MGTPEAVSTATSTRILLVVDDEPEICKLIKRSLRGEFDEIHLAEGQSEAESVLSTTPVTHVVCDFYLATGDTLGDRLLVEWRDSWPSIEYAALFTGSTLERVAGHEKIDDVFLKPNGFSDLVDHLRQPAH
jgi:DNA-binding response OmpR family regulator